jgi:hypothetical protein
MTVAEPRAVTAAQGVPYWYGLQIYRGDTEAWRFFLWQDAAQSKPVDLTGVSATAQIRPQPDSQTIIDLSCVVTLPNQIDVSLDADDSAAAVAGFWDLELTYASGVVDTVIAGPVAVTLDITQP